MIKHMRESGQTLFPSKKTALSQSFKPSGTRQLSLSISGFPQQTTCGGKHVAWQLFDLMFILLLLGVCLF